MQTTFKIGDTRVEKDGSTVQLCLTSTGKEIWRKLGENGQPIARGRAKNQSILEEISFLDLCKALVGTKQAQALKKAAENKALFGAKVMVGSTWAKTVERVAEVAETENV